MARLTEEKGTVNSDLEKWKVGAKGNTKVMNEHKHFCTRIPVGETY